MISTRRIVAAVGLTVGVTGFASPLANAADAAVPSGGSLNPVATLDSLAVSDIPAAHKAEIPRVSAQLTQLKRLNDLHQPQQVTGLFAPVTGLVPGNRH
jgi:hypothetical protein